jgi:hypothetical protein
MMRMLAARPGRRPRRFCASTSQRNPGASPLSRLLFGLEVDNLMTLTKRGVTVSEDDRFVAESEG